jgi:DNA-directed RNA polymerase specialized sigma24 family protein
VTQRGTDDERALRDAALTGDEDAMKRLVALLTPVVQMRVGAVLLRMKARKGADLREEVKDLTQDVFMHLFEGRGRMLQRWEPARGASLSTFVGLIAHRRAISGLRGRDAVGGDDLPDVDTDVPADESPPELRAASRQELQLLLSRLQRELSPLGLDLFYRLLVHDEPIEALSASTGLTANALYIWRTRLIKLTHKLYAELAQDGAGAPFRPEAATPRAEGGVSR